MDQLRADVTEKKLTPQESKWDTEELAILEKLKVYGRTVTGSDAIYSSEGITFLAEVAFRPNNPDSSREALRCLANALYLDRQTVQYFTDAGYVEKASEAYRSENVDDEFLLGRVLFFSTTFANDDNLLNKWVNEHHLVENNIAAISRHASAYAAAASTISLAVPMMQTMALQDTLKLLYTLTTKLSDVSTILGPTIPHLLSLLSSLPLQSPPLQAPTHHILDALSNISPTTQDSQTSYFPPSNPTLHISKILKILDKSAVLPASSRGTTADDFDTYAASLLKLLIEIYPFSPDSVKQLLRETLLPSEKERSSPLGSQNSTTLPARLLRLASSPATTNTRIILQTLLFVISDEDPVKFVKNVGYGHASGYLMMRGIPVPSEALEETAEDGGKSSGKRINPITGQYLDDELRDIEASGLRGLEGMTDEEKEMEAEKLFVLFERLNRTGVINVENPVRTAMQEGRFEEIKSDDEDSDDDDDDDDEAGKGKGKGKAKA
ncbi:uncharacterized protein DFL_002547 [Arthrobotrys flagrans]|uniref:Uncharacterized protein n=1 Tax=Arthrobotrys flagrans TaxID=97331 RepID=A0A437AC36_ARTFL|nr:hypothetical protein DFL_002547 [Arthrobotrys flagrans]